MKIKVYIFIIFLLSVNLMGCNKKDDINDEILKNNEKVNLLISQYEETKTLAETIVPDMNSFFISNNDINSVPTCLTEYIDEEDYARYIAKIQDIYKYLWEDRESYDDNTEDTVDYEYNWDYFYTVDNNSVMQVMSIGYEEKQAEIEFIWKENKIIDVYTKAGDKYE